MRSVLMLMVLACADVTCADVAYADEVAAPDAAPLVLETPAAVELLTPDAGAAVVAPVEVPPVVETDPQPSVEVTVSPTESGSTTVSVDTEPAPSTWEALGWQIAGYVVPVLGSFLIALVGFGIQWLRAQTGNLKWQGAIDKLHDAVNTAVLSVQQVVVDGLRKAAEDGELTKAEAEEVFAKALASVKATMGVEGLSALQTAMKASQEAFEAYLRAKIESRVAVVKVGEPTPPTATLSTPPVQP